MQGELVLSNVGGPGPIWDVVRTRDGKRRSRVDEVNFIFLFFISTRKSIWPTFSVTAITKTPRANRMVPGYAACRP